jgi:hypothetical protein
MRLAVFLVGPVLTAVKRWPAMYGSGVEQNIRNTIKIIRMITSFRVMLPEYSGMGRSMIILREYVVLLVIGALPGARSET